jgi:hypothetical protein
VKDPRRNMDEIIAMLTRSGAEAPTESASAY